MPGINPGQELRAVKQRLDRGLCDQDRKNKGTIEGRNHCSSDPLAQISGHRQILIVRQGATSAAGNEPQANNDFTADECRHGCH